MTGAQYDAIIQLGIDANQSLKDITSQLQNAAGVMEKSFSNSAKKSGRSLKNETSKGIQNGMREGANKSNSFISSMAKQIKNRISLTLAQGIVDAYKRAFRDVIENVKELNDAQTEFKKVSNLSGQDLDEYSKKAAKAGRVVGRTGTEMVQAATEFKKAGYSEKDSLTLATVATKFQNIADAEISSADAAKFINAQMKAFNIDANEAITIIDKVNETANNFAFGTDDMQKALTLSASSMKGFGNDINQTIAILGANMELMPNKASQIARGWNAIGANILKLSQEETAWVAANGKVNIEFRKTDGQLKSTYELLTDLYNGIEGQSSAWKNLSNEEKSAMAISIAGKNHQQKFMATMENFGAALGDGTDKLGIYETALKSNDSANKENEKAMQSLQGALNRLNAAWTELSTDLIKGGTLTKLVNFATKIVKILDKMVNTIGGIPTSIIAIVTSIGLLSNALKLLELPSMILQFSKFGKALGAFGALRTGTALSTIAGGAGGAGGVGGALLSSSSIFGTISDFKSLKKKYQDIDKLELASQSLYKKRGEEYKAIQAARKELGIANSQEAQRELKALGGTTKGINSNVAALETLEQAATIAGGALAGTAAALLVIGGLAWVGKKIDEDFGFEGATKKAKKYSDKLSEVDNKIDTLKSKDTLTDDEKEQLAILEAEREVLKDQVALYEQRAHKAVSRSVKGDGTKLEESGTNAGVVYISKLSELKSAKEELQLLQATKTQLEDNLKTVEKGSAEWFTYKQQLDQVNKDIVAQGTVIDDLTKSTNEYKAQAISDWREMRKAYGDSYQYMDKTAKAIYDNAHKYAIAARDDITDEVAVASSEIIDLLGSNTFGKLLSDGDLTNFKTADEMLSSLQEKMHELDEGTTIKLFARDEAGNIIDQLKIDKGELTNDEWDIILSAETTGNWDEVDNIINKYKGTEGKENVVDFLVNLKTQSKDGKNSFFTADQLNPTVKFKPDTTKVDNKIKSYKTPITQTVNFKVGTTVSKKDGIVQKAVGKRKGEQGGLAWVGDEGSSRVSFGI